MRVRGFETFPNDLNYNAPETDSCGVRENGASIQSLHIDAALNGLPEPSSIVSPTMSTSWR